MVEAVGERVSGIRPGDRVAYTGHPGSYSEYTAIEAERLISLPESAFEQGAAIPLQGMTAHYLIHDFRKPKPGETVMVHAAAGGVGLLLVQWAKHFGARVIGTVSTEEKARVAKEAGADQVILYTKQDFVSESKRLTDGRGAEIIDGVAKSTFPGDLEAIAVHGHVVIFGASSGPADPIVPNSLGEINKYIRWEPAQFYGLARGSRPPVNGRCKRRQGRVAEASHRPCAADGRGGEGAPTA